MIVDQDLIVLRKLRHLRDAPRREADTGAGHQHQRLAHAIKFIIQIDVVDFDFTALDRLYLIHAALQSKAIKICMKNSMQLAVTLSNPKISVNMQLLFARASNESLQT